MTRQAIIFRGPPASGKTTLSKMLAERMRTNCALLSLDVFRWDFHGLNRDPDKLNNKEHSFAYANFLEILRRYCENGTYDIVIEGSFTLYKNDIEGSISDVIRILESYSIRHTKFVLYSDTETLWDRNLCRTYIVPRKPFEQIYNSIGMSKVGYQEILLDVGNATPDETIKTIIGNLKL